MSCHEVYPGNTSTRRPKKKFMKFYFFLSNYFFDVLRFQLNCVAKGRSDKIECGEKKIGSRWHVFCSGVSFAFKVSRQLVH